MHPHLSLRPGRSILTLSMLALVALPGSPASAVTPVRPSASPAESASPSGMPDGQQIILQMDVCCGFVPQTVRQLSMPTFTLYADGTAIYRPSTGGTIDAPPPLMQAQLSPEQVDALIGYALGPGGLAAADAVYDDRFVTDQHTTTFIIDADGVSKTVSAYALGFPAPEPRPNETELARLAALADTLSHFDVQVAAGHVESSQVYEPTQYLAIVTPDTSDGSAEASEWPVPGVELVMPADGSAIILTLTPEQVSQVTTVPSGGIGGIVYTTPDGQRVSVTIRPMLPGEQAPMTAA
jgi:hypothetical protein